MHDREREVRSWEEKNQLEEKHGKSSGSGATGLEQEWDEDHCGEQHDCDDVAGIRRGYV